MLNNSRNYWVFRIPKAPGGEEPNPTCPWGINPEAISTGLEASQSIIQHYDGCLQFVIDEFLGKTTTTARKRLRQGWGIPTLDLRLPMHVWIENYMIAQYKYHNQNIDDDSCKRAAKRYGILKQMMEMNEGDIIFVPNVGNGCLDESKYYVCQVKKEYYFEDRSQKPNTWEKDFGHIIEVKNAEMFTFNTSNTLNRSIFGAPFMRAIDQAKKHYASYQQLDDFINNVYLKKIAEKS